FASSDKGCQPDIGTAARADLRWLGATARIVPPPPGQSEAATDAPFGSLILYRRDLGPPPGALLLDRRRTIGLRCANPVQQILYNRLFVPVAEMPAPSRCMDLAATYRPDGAREQTLRFTTSDRVVLLMPEDADTAYRRIRHDVGVVLYDGLGCTGTALAIKGAASLTRDVRLAQFDFRDRARSLKLVYNAGALEPFMTPPPAPVVEAPPLAPPTPPAPPPKPPVDLATAPMSDPAVALEPPPEEDDEPALEAPAIPAPQVAPAPKVAAKVVPAPKVVSKAAPAPKVAAKAAPAPKVAAKAAPAPKVAPKAASAMGQQAALPKLRPILPPLPGRVLPPDGASEIFEFPVHEIYRLNYCLFSGSQCGEPAAVAWCKTRGFPRATAWKIDENIGGLFPTIMLAEKRVCANSVCDGFREITCAK
ncbi:MAG: hypothetical protein ACE5DS_08940, partial [Kiloniellaceae bacterium]